MLVGWLVVVVGGDAYSVLVRAGRARYAPRIAGPCHLRIPVRKNYTGVLYRAFPALPALIASTIGSVKNGR